MSCLIDTKTPGGKLNYIVTRLYPGHELPQFWELASEKCDQKDPGTDDELSKTTKTKMLLVRPLVTNLKMTVRADCAVSTYSHFPPPHPISKSSCPLLVGGGVGWGSQPWNRYMPPSPPSGQHLKWRKLSFPPAWPVYWLLSGQQLEPAHTLLVTQGHWDAVHL